MNNFRKDLLIVVLTIFLSVNATAQQTNSSVAESDVKVSKKSKKNKKKKKYKIPKILPVPGKLAF